MNNLLISFCGVTFQTFTYIVTRRDGSTFEVNTTPEFLAKWQERLGWTAQEVKPS